MQIPNQPILCLKMRMRKRSLSSYSEGLLSLYICSFSKFILDPCECVACRLRKGKARAMPEDEEEPSPPPQVLLGSAIHNERLNRPLIRPLPSEESSRGGGDSNSQSPPVVIPPPPAKHVERQKFFKEKKVDGASGLPGHMRGLSLHSPDGSSSRSGSVDFSD